MAARNPRKTRQRLLQTAFQEMHARGFQGMRVDDILRLSGLRKGAFYHHFGSKTELGYAVLEEQIRPLIETIWLEPVADMDNPTRDLPKLLESLGQRVPPAMREHGCPLNNLAQEMACLDQGFQQRIAGLFDDWIAAFQSVFEKAKQRGHVRDDVDCHEVARFVVAVLEGCIGLFKVNHAARQWEACRSQLAAYLSTLEPQR